MYPNDKILVICSNLTYKGKDNIRIVTRSEWFVLAEQNRTNKYKKFLFERCGSKKFQSKQREIYKYEYSLAIQKKYNVGENWEENRWFVEQVRPTIFNY
jgi:hypothetical protein